MYMTTGSYSIVLQSLVFGQYVRAISMKSIKGEDKGFVFVRLFSVLETLFWCRLEGLKRVRSFGSSLRVVGWLTGCGRNAHQTNTITRDSKLSCAVKCSCF